MKGVFVVFSTLLGAALALDLIGCYRKPKEINALLALQGDIYSPGYQEGEVYPNDLFCQYVIRAPYGFRIRLKFEDLDLEVYDLCEKDALEVFDGDNPMENPVHGIFCGNGTNPDIVSITNALYIVFRTDFMIGKKGFHLKYHASVSQNLCDRSQRACRNRNCYNPSQECDGVDDCGDGTDESNCGLPLAETACGLREIESFSDSSDRVIGGKEATPGSWPWQADLQLSYIFPNGHMCGGTLINAQWILTAAHCFMQNRHPQEWRIHLGKHNKFKRDEFEQVRHVDRIIAYPDLTDNKLIMEGIQDLENDIALMKLNAPIKFTKYVRPACLPDLGYSLKPSTKCVGTGWGMTRGTGSSDVLKEVDLWIEKEEVCNTEEFGPINNKTKICVSNRKGFQDVCHGDSGGPLLCEMYKAWHVVGATSHGTVGTLEGGLCGLPGSYTVYSKVSDKVEWIRKMINKYSFH